MWAWLHVGRMMKLEDKWKSPTTLKKFPSDTFPSENAWVRKKKDGTLKPFPHYPGILVKCQVRSGDRHGIKILSLKWAGANTVHWLGSKKLNQSQSCGISTACILFSWTVLKLGGALLSGGWQLGCDPGGSFSESIYSVIANECSVFERKKELERIIMGHLS